MTPVAPQKSKQTNEVGLIPDIALLIEARVKAGERNVQMKVVSNLILHDPVLTIEFLSYANSVMYGGAAVADVESAITRLGIKRVIALLSELNGQAPTAPVEVREVIEILRYNCRRYSIVTLILAGVLNPSLVVAARASGLFADIGHMLAAMQLGTKYCEAAKANKRNTLPFRLQKDHNFDVNQALVRYLKAKSVPRLLIMPYDLDEKAKPGAETDLRLLVQAARELIESYDSGKWETYNPNRPLPAKSVLRMLSTLPFQQQRIYQAVQEYLKLAAAEEAPEGASLLISAADGDEIQPLNEAADLNIETLVVPRYPNLSVSPKSRDALKDFFELCEGTPDEMTLSAKSVDSLKKSGIFARAAILRVSADGKSIAVENAAGLGVGPGETIALPPEQSPFGLLRVQVRSAQISNEAAPAPFGTTAFGLGPLEDMPTGDRRALYVDCSNAEAFKLESRRVFRLVLGLLAQSLQSARNGPAK
ncbi:MAG: HDOD domain-containing protein [Bdellovibrionota bacterium]